MRAVRLAGALAAAIAPLPCLAATPVEAGADARAARGIECRIETAAGAVRVYRPPGYEPRSAGTVVYVHGYYTTLDETWTRDDLPGQFAQSRRNALFVAPAAPASNGDGVPFPDLRELLRAAGEGCSVALPRGPLIVAGHSAAFRTFLGWLVEPALRQVLMLDALYGNVNIAPFRRWVQGSTSRAPRQLLLLAEETMRESLRLARSVRGAVRRASLPASADDFTRAQRRARVLYVRSQYGHDDIVQGRQAIPVVLGLTPLPALPQVATTAQAQPLAPSHRP